MIIAIRHDLTRQGLDAGNATIGWHLAAPSGVGVSIHDPPLPRRRRPRHGPNHEETPRSSYIRFQADHPNESWQADFTHYRLADGADTEILTWLDDHSRYALSVTAHARVTGPIVVDTFTHSDR